MTETLACKQSFIFDRHFNSFCINQYSITAYYNNKHQLYQIIDRDSFDVKRCNCLYDSNSSSLIRVNRSLVRFFRKTFPLLLNKFDPERRLKELKGRRNERHRVFLQYESLLSPASFPIKLVRLCVHQVVTRVQIILPLVLVVGHG